MAKSGKISFFEIGFLFRWLSPAKIISQSLFLACLFWILANKMAVGRSFRVIVLNRVLPLSFVMFCAGMVGCAVAVLGAGSLLELGVGKQSRSLGNWNWLLFVHPCCPLCGWLFGGRSGFLYGGRPSPLLLSLRLFGWIDVYLSMALRIDVSMVKKKKTVSTSYSLWPRKPLAVRKNYKMSSMDDTNVPIVKKPEKDKLANIYKSLPLIIVINSTFTSFIIVYSGPSNSSSFQTATKYETGLYDLSNIPSRAGASYKAPWCSNFNNPSPTLSMYKSVFTSVFLLADRAKWLPHPLFTIGEIGS